MKKTLAMILAAANIAAPVQDCKPDMVNGSFIGDEKGGWYCNCREYGGTYDELMEGCKGAFVEVMEDPFSIDGLRTNIEKLKEKLGDTRITDLGQGCRMIEYEGLTAMEGCCMYENMGMMYGEDDPDNRFIYRYDITNPDLVLKHDIKMGLDRIITILRLGKPSFICTNQDIYACEAGGAESQLILRYEDNKISRIMINHFPD